jgi:hypothetical protein
LSEGARGRRGSPSRDDADDRNDRSTQTAYSAPRWTLRELDTLGANVWEPYHTATLPLKQGSA